MVVVLILDIPQTTVMVDLVQMVVVLVDIVTVIPEELDQEHKDIMAAVMVVNIIQVVVVAPVVLEHQVQVEQMVVQVNSQVY